MDIHKGGQGAHISTAFARFSPMSEHNALFLVSGWHLRRACIPVCCQPHTHSTYLLMLYSLASPLFIAASMLEAMEDEGDFAEAMTDKLNMILLTVPEAATLRRKLMLEDLIQDGDAAKVDGKDRDSRVVFETLFRSWCLCPVAALTLCLVRSPAISNACDKSCCLKCV
jgi:hypothetical protein